MKKILLATAVCAVFSFAGDSTDLLAFATGGIAKGASYELSSNEMQSVQGGQYYRIGGVTDYGLYRQTVGNITEGYMGNYTAKMYARKMKSGGSPAVWINYVQNGTTWQAYGLEANRLVNLYRNQAEAGL